MSSPDNYKNFLSKFSFCGYNRTWSEPGSLIINSLIIRNYKLLLDAGKDYFSMTEDDYKLNDIQKESLKKHYIADGFDGYIRKEKLEASNYCERCFKITNYGDFKKIDTTGEEYI